MFISGMVFFVSPEYCNTSFKILYWQFTSTRKITHRSLHTNHCPNLLNFFYLGSKTIFRHFPHINDSSYAFDVLYQLGRETGKIWISLHSLSLWLWFVLITFCSLFAFLVTNLITQGQKRNQEFEKGKFTVAAIWSDLWLPSCCAPNDHTFNIVNKNAHSYIHMNCMYK